MKNVLSWIRDIVIAIIIAAIILAFFKPIIVRQESMQPNFYSGDYVITSRQAYRLFGTPERGDVIVFKTDLYDENGDPRPIESRVKIKTLKFEYNVPRMVSGYEEITEDNTLYFGYACWAAANSAAQYFTMTAFNISDWENYVEMPRSDDNTASDYYFKIDDSRFDTVKDLKKYLKSIFIPKTAERIFAAAPQRYTDINGELYGIAGDGGYDFTLGTLTFSDVSVTEDRMVFRSRQEKFDETGNFTGYTDGGNFVIERCEDGLWRVSEYRYPYSLN